MRIAICYSGQMRCARLVVKNHVKNLLQPLCNAGYELDIFIYTDRFNTARKKCKDADFKFEWIKTPLDNAILEYFVKNIKPYSRNDIQIIVNDKCNYKEDRYLDNIISQLEKFRNVLRMIPITNDITNDIVNNSKYDIIIRLRPDIIFPNSINDNLLNNIVNIGHNLYQNCEVAHDKYNGDAIQVFHYKYLECLIKNLDKKINELNEINSKKHNPSLYYYEHIINEIFKSSKLNLIWIDDLAARWIDRYSGIFPAINIEYIHDWESLEYSRVFNMDTLDIFSNIRKRENKILTLDDNLVNLLETHVETPHMIKHLETNLENHIIYLAALNPDIINIEKSIKITERIKSYITHNIMHDIIGLIPCSGTATRMGGIPKFLLPCPSISSNNNNNLIINSIDLMKNNGIEDIYIAVSKENEHFVKPLNMHDSKVKYIVRNTATMSETVKHLVNIPANKYILIMPDTYFINDTNREFPELTELNIKLNKFDIVVILWKIKEYQYGKLGQIEINLDSESGEVINIMDKNPECRYPYSWGVIGWTNRVNHLIDPETPHIGYIINTALEKGIKVGYVLSTNTEYYDCGTPSEYFKMIKQQCKDSG